MMNGNDYKDALVDLAFKFRDDSESCQGCDCCELNKSIEIPKDNGIIQYARYCDVLIGIINTNSDT